MDNNSFDIAVSGAGLTGLVAALAFGRRGYSVLCVDPNADATPDRRTTAYLQPAQAFLEDLGFWPKIQDAAAPLDIMRIVDASAPTTPVNRDFKSQDLSDKPFGWNIANSHMCKMLLSEIAVLSNVRIISGCCTTHIFTRTTGAKLTLSNGDKVNAKLVIAADGRYSIIREKLGVQCSKTDFGQTALAFAATHPVPHQNISTEVHKTGGPFTLVPLPDRSNLPCSGIVWMDDADKIDVLRAMNPDDFAQAATERCDAILGPLSPVTQPAAWPIMSQVADTFYGERTALVGEAAHVVPPIGAQGFNMSLADIESLLHHATQSDDPGASTVLQAYHNDRHQDVSLRARGIGLLNRFSQAENSFFQGLRRLGLTALHGAKPLRHTVMKWGWTTGGGKISQGFTSEPQ